MSECGIPGCAAPAAVPMVLALRPADGEQPVMVCVWHADWVQRMEWAERG